MKHVKKIGEGTYGTVHVVEDEDGNKLALKRNAVPEQMSFAGSLNEVDTLHRVLNHPYMVQIKYVLHDANPCNGTLPALAMEGQRNDEVHFVFELADGDLHSIIHEDLLWKGDPSAEDFGTMKDFMLQLLLSVEFLHQRGIIHRDIKPNNALYCKDQTDVMGKPGIVKLCDFGLCKPHVPTPDGTPDVASPYYRGPEICMGWRDYDYSIDIWALGCVFFEMVARKSFMSDPGKTNEHTLRQILSRLPVVPNRKELTALLRRSPHPLNIPLPAKVKQTWMDRLALHSGDRAKFNATPGSLADFCDLLDKMLQFNPQKRWTVGQLLSHRFFVSHTEHIATVRAMLPPPDPREERTFFVPCMERGWCYNAAFDIFNKHEKLPWYNHRMLFLALDLADRYLAVMHHGLTEEQKNREITDTQGLVHTREEMELRFLAMLYMAMKFYISIYVPASFLEIASDEYQNPECIETVRAFEESLIVDCLQYRIRRDTLYEVAARDPTRRMDDVDVSKLLYFLAHHAEHDNLSMDELYERFQEAEKEGFDGIEMVEVVV